MIFKNILFCLIFPLRILFEIYYLLLLICFAKERLEVRARTRSNVEAGRQRHRHPEVIAGLRAVAQTYGRRLDLA